MAQALETSSMERSGSLMCRALSPTRPLAHAIALEAVTPSLSLGKVSILSLLPAIVAPKVVPPLRLTVRSSGRQQAALVGALRASHSGAAYLWR